MQERKEQKRPSKAELQSWQESLLCLQERLNCDKMQFMAISKALMRLLSGMMQPDDEKAAQLRVSAMIGEYRSIIANAHVELIRIADAIDARISCAATPSPPRRMPMLPPTSCWDEGSLQGVSALASLMERMDHYKGDISECIKNRIRVCALPLKDDTGDNASTIGKES